tara:strand:- start:742 stop:1056 length:315 start_codon:yes stop_codon:yes gene_type:complete
MFKLSQDADVGGTHLQGYVTLPPAALVDKFGRGESFDGYKTSGEYSFESEDGEVFTVYDWKTTELYCPDGIPVDQLWSSWDPFQFNVGGKSNAIDFITWLEAQV